MKKYMPKQSTIQIHDAKNKGAMGYRVKFGGKNGECLNNSEVLESVTNVHNNIVRTINAGVIDPWIESISDVHSTRRIEDHTTTQKFLRYGAKSGLKVKPKSKKK